MMREEENRRVASFEKGEFDGVVLKDATSASIRRPCRGPGIFLVFVLAAIAWIY